MGKDIAKWKILDSEYLLRHKYMMLRKDKVELNNGHIINDYFVIEKAIGLMSLPSQMKENLCSSGSIAMVQV